MRIPGEEKFSLPLNFLIQGKKNSGFSDLLTTELYIQQIHFQGGL